MKDRSFGFGVALASIPVCMFAMHCDMPASQLMGASVSANQKGTLQLLLTEQLEPFEFIESAIITITRIEVRRDGALDVNDTIDFCTTHTCVDSACIPIARDCDDGDACTEDACDPSTGACSHISMTCAADEACVLGQCLNTCANDEACDDGDPCTNDTCINGVCVLLDKCVSSDACLDVSCHPDTGACTFAPTLCDAGQVCIDGGCVALCTTDGDCDDNDLCTSDVCGSHFACEYITIDCDDGDACTTDACDPATGVCINDDMVCAAHELCVEGSCYTACMDSPECGSADSDSDDSDDSDSGDNDSDDSDDSDENDDDSANSDFDDHDDLHVEDEKSVSAGKMNKDEDDDSDDDMNAEDDRDDSGDDEDSDDDSGDDDNSFTVIFEGERDLDLLALQDGRTDLLAETDIPAGKYSQMRLIVTEGEVTLTDGRVFPLRVPSGEQTGIKLHFDFDIYDGEETTLLLDVDLSQAFQPIPGGVVQSVSDITDFIFRPSIAMSLIHVE